MGLVDFPSRRVIVEGARQEYVVANERVYGPDPNVPGATTLLYPVGHLIPLEEAVRLGLVEDAAPAKSKAVEPAEAEDKAVKDPPASKASKRASSKTRASSAKGGSRRQTGAK